MEFVREHTLLNKLIIVDGVGKSGKSLFLSLIGAFEHVEKWNFNECLEFIALGYNFNKISADMASAILKTEMDTALYNNMIGRHVNTRILDDSCVYKYHSPEKYLKRALEQGGPIIHQKVLEEQPIYLASTHDLINKSDIIFDTFKEKLEFIYINRRPVDVIYEWNAVQYAARMSKDPTEMQYCIKHKNTSVPFAALGWEEEFLECTLLEKTIRLIHTFFKLNRDALLKKQHFSNLHVMNFEDIITNPYNEIERLKLIIKNPPLPFFYKVVREANCPRVIDEMEYAQREKEIKEKASSKYVELISETNIIHDDIRRMSF